MVIKLLSCCQKNKIIIQITSFTIDLLLPIRFFSSTNFNLRQLQRNDYPVFKNVCSFTTTERTRKGNYSEEL